MISNEKIKLIAQNCGADLCGIACVDRFSSAPIGFHPRDIYEPTQSVIAFAIRIPDAAFASPTPVPYTFFTTQIFSELARMTYRFVLELDHMGIIAVPAPSEPYEYWDKNTMTGKGILSLKHAAALAGLGTINRNHLLTNHRYGNRITIGALLTDTVISPDAICEDPQCPPSCNVCRKLCPVNAISDEGVNQKLCRSISEGLNERGYYLYWCRVCREKCPLSRGKKKNKNLQENTVT